VLCRARSASISGSPPLGDLESELHVTGAHSRQHEPSIKSTVDERQSAPASVA
jgi:hypothetical protein